MLKKILCAALSVMLVLSVGFIGASAEGGDYVIVSPYKDVVWEGDNAWGAYKGTLHSHTTYSDASESLSSMIKEYYNQDYDFVANADHGVTGVDWDEAPLFPALYLYQPIIGCKYEHLTTEEYTAIQNGTYPLYDGTVRNKKMVPVLGANELNFIALSKNHVNGYFLDGATGMGFQSFEGIAGYEDAVAFADANGGLSHINHPGDWLNSNANPEVVNDPEMVKQFGDIMLKYDSCLGTEVFNERNGTTGYDRILWDNLLMYTLPYGKNVIGFSNTDAHTHSTVDSSFSIFMMEENNVENIKETMQNGNFFMVTRKLRENVVEDSNIGPDKEFDVIDSGLPYPMFTEVSVDGHKITVAAKDADKLQFIANGKVIAKYDIGENAITLDLDTIDGAEDFLYVRAEILGEGGMTLTQALTIDNGDEPLEFVEKTGIEALWEDILAVLSSLRIVVIVQEIIRAI